MPAKKAGARPSIQACACACARLFVETGLDGLQVVQQLICCLITVFCFLGEGFEREAVEFGRDARIKLRRRRRVIAYDLRADFDQPLACKSWLAGQAFVEQRA